MKYAWMFIYQLMFIGMAINIRIDIPFWKQFMGYCIIALIMPAAEWMNNYSKNIGLEKTND